jgi:hypothetical protein
LSNATANTQVWDITDPLNPARMPGTLISNQFRFINTCTRLREYAAFNPDNLLVPVAAGAIANQNLHNTSPADYIIVVHPLFITGAAPYYQQQRVQNPQ